MTDKDHLDWKIEQVRRVIEEEIPEIQEKIQETLEFAASTQM